jgi:hypothetical protein
MGKIAVGLRLNRELLDRVNEARGDVPKNRWIERALEAALDGGLGLGQPSGGATDGQATASPAAAPPASPRASEVEGAALVPKTTYTAREIIESVASGEPRRFMCPKDCRPGFRPTSDKVRCPECYSRVVPEPE